MALKAILASLDGLEPAQRALYVERDGKFVLDVDPETAEEAFATGLKRNRDEAVREARAAKDKLRQWDGIDPEEYKRLKAGAEEAERKKAEAQGNWQALEQQLKARHAEELASVSQRADKALKALEDHAVRGTLATALAKAGARPEFAELLMLKGQQFVRVRETDNGFESFIGDPTGTPLVADGQGTPMTVDLFVEQKLKAQYPDAFAGSGSSGGGAAKSIAGGGGTKVLAGTNTRDFLANVEKIASGEARVAT